MNFELTNFERELTMSQAMQAWQSTVNDLKIEYQLREYGDSHYKTFECMMMRNGFEYQGIGKGSHVLKNELSAKYEAIERLLGSIHCYPTNHIKAYGRDIPEKTKIIPFRCQENFISDVHAIQIPWLPFKEIRGDREGVVPLASFDYSYVGDPETAEENFLYGKNSLIALSNGIATGHSEAEALIHAILEIIERDATSYFLIDTFLLNKPIHVVAKESLPHYLQELIKDVEQTYDEKITVFQMPSKYDVYCYGAVFNNKEYVEVPVGFGASLIKDYALDRAITEAIQGVHVQLHHLCDVQENINEIQDFPSLVKCYRFDIEEAIQNCGVILQSFESNSSLLYNTVSIEDYLKLLVDKVYNVGSEIWVNQNFSNEWMSSVRVIIPDAEEFCYVMYGQLIGFKAHTKKYIEKNRGR